MRVHDFNPAEGQAFQGDVAIIPIPSDIPISRHDEIAPKDGKLILQEGELTGHHHHIVVPRERNFRKTESVSDPVLNVRDTRLRKALGGKKTVASAPTARMFRDPSVASAMQHRGILARTDLVVGLLVVEGGAMTITHQEHDGVRVPPGNYLIGRQIESAGAEERAVKD